LSAQVDDCDVVTEPAVEAVEHCLRVVVNVANRSMVRLGERPEPARHVARSMFWPRQEKHKVDPHQLARPLGVSRNARSHQRLKPLGGCWRIYARMSADDASARSSLRHWYAIDLKSCDEAPL
jgi:hypothetical protein